MALPDIFSRSVSDQVIERINRLTPETRPQWGKMNAGQMLAQCKRGLRNGYDGKFPKPGFFLKFMLKTFVEKSGLQRRALQKEQPHCPCIPDHRRTDFEKEKTRLVDYINKTQRLGSQAFSNKESLSFGRLSVPEWNNMFYKHLDHHLTQFGV